MRIQSVAKPQYLFRPARSVARLVGALQRNHRKPRVVEVSLPWGTAIRVNTGERVGRSIWRSGVHDLPVAEALWRLLDPGDTAIDVGANIGYTASLMAARVGRSGSVLCFEPHPDVFSELATNIALGRRAVDAAAMQAHQIALSDRSGEALLVSGENFAENRGSSRLAAGESIAADSELLRVPTRRLDEFIAEGAVAVVKIDVEGHELGVLSGAAQALAQGRIAHIVYEDFGGAGSEVHRLLASNGYSLYALGWATHKPVLSSVEAGPSIDLRWESPNYLATRYPEHVADRFKPWGVI